MQRTRLALAVLATALLALGASPARADYLGYPVDSEVKIYINWEAFEAQGIPSSWKGPFTDCVINAYTRWMHVAGARFRPRLMGYTTKTSPAADEILITMNEKHADSTRLASRFNKPATIVFHRKSGATNTNWNFVPYRANDGEFDMQAILMHELGHAFGLEHEDADPRSTMNGSYGWHRWRFGPFTKDVADLRAQYGARTDLRARIHRSTDSGATWAPHTTNLTSLGVTTTNDPTAVRDTNRTLFFYTHPNKHPAWIHADNTGATYDTSKWWVYGGISSHYGTTGHGWGNEYMMAWVDPTGNDMRVQVVYSSDGAISWSYRNPPSGSAALGTPAVHKLADHTWLLGYVKMNWADSITTGQVVVRVSMDDGWTWGPEVVLTDAYRSDNGLSISSTGPEAFRIGFSWSLRTTGANYLKRTILGHLSGATPVFDRMIFESESSRTQPVMNRNYAQYAQAWREPNAATSVNTRTSAFTATTWDNYVRVVETAFVTPSIASYKDYGYMFLYTVNDF